MGLFLCFSSISVRMSLDVSKKIAWFDWLKQHGSIFHKKSRSRPAPKLLNSTSGTQVLSMSLLCHPPGTALFSELRSAQGYKDGCYISRCHCQTQQCLVEEESQCLPKDHFLKSKKPFSRSTLTSHCPKPVQMPNHNQSQARGMVPPWLTLTIQDYLRGWGEAEIRTKRELQ